MTARNILMAAAGGTTAANYIEDVFSTWLYTGNGSTQTITNGIDLASKGGLVWAKERVNAYSHGLYDTARGINKELYSNETSAQYSGAGTLTAFNSNGFTLGASSTANAGSAVSWTFRKQPKFFDVVTYTGNSTARTISHSLGSAPGCIIVKATSASSYQWAVYHRSLVAGNIVWLNLTDASTASSNTFTTTAPTATEFSLGTASGVNDNGVTYVAYLFAHNAGGFGLTGTDNVISCGSFTTDGSGNATVALGYETQWVLTKRTDSTSDWVMLDNMRGWSYAGSGGGGKRLKANTTEAESADGIGTPLATGFSYLGQAASANYIYIAIRRGPMKVPTDGTKVYTSASRNGTAGVIPRWTSGFPVDWALRKSDVTTGGGDWQAGDRLRGAVQLKPNLTEAETSASLLYTFDSMTGYSSLGISGSDTADRSWMFRRAPGFFDEVCYTGTGSAQNVTHNLTVAPELMIVKCRNDAGRNWQVYSSALGNGYRLALNQTLQALTTSIWDSTTPTSTQFRVSSDPTVGASTFTYVAYLFASCPGVSKVGSVTHVEPTTVSCGFTPRFVLLKSTASTGTDDWFVFDSARGITAGNDPYLRLNSTGAENTPFGAADLIDPTADGFIMNGFGGGNYIYLAIA